MLGREIDTNKAATSRMSQPFVCRAAFVCRAELVGPAWEDVAVEVFL